MILKSIPAHFVVTALLAQLFKFLFYFSNSSLTLPVESTHNYEQIAISPDGTLLFAVNEGTVDIFLLVFERKKTIHNYYLIVHIQLEQQI